MAFTIRIDGADAEALQREADAQGVAVEDVARSVISDHVARASGALDAQVAAARADTEFQRLLSEVVERDREILDRLAE